MEAAVELEFSADCAERVLHYRSDGADCDDANCGNQSQHQGVLGYRCALAVANERPQRTNRHGSIARYAPEMSPAIVVNILFRLVPIS